MGRMECAVAVLGLGLVASFQLGCEDAPPPVVQEQVRQQQAPPEPAAEPRPTTQELLSGRMRRITLSDWPISMQVPQSWEIDNDNTKGFVFLEGYAPGGMVQIQLAQRPSMGAEQLEHMIDAAKRDVAGDSRSRRSVDVREADGFRVMQRKGPGATIMINAIDEDGQLREVPHTPYSWTINLLVPAGEMVENYELNFFDLTQEQYESDQAFFENMLSTLRLEGAPSPAPPPAPALQ